MSNPPVIKYPLDLTGQSPTNLVVGETHTVSVSSQPAFVLNYGPFYTQGLIVTRTDTGQVLIPGQVGSTNGQYVATQLFVDMTMRTGLEICSVIVLTDETLPSNLTVSVTAQMLGGEYSTAVDAIQQLINALDLANKPVLWADILGKPVLFPPAPHLHDLGDIYGFEYIVASLERIVQAIYVGDDAQLQAVYAYINHQISAGGAGSSATAATLAAHLANYSNPHQVTAVQVGLGSVQNFGLATTAGAQAGIDNASYMTPALTAAAIAIQVGAPLTEHIDNYNNPHAVTAAQIGLGNVPNYPMAATADALAGTSNVKFMSPALTASAISQAINALPAQTVTTAASIGLGNVQNYGMATVAQAQTGTSANVYMSPLTTAAAITAQVGNALAAHVGNYDNPHAVTATQVGLGNVNNTSDLNKPISTATAGALATKATLNVPVQFTGVYLNASEDVYLYEYVAGGLGLRTGTSTGYAYSTLDPSGNLTIPGLMIAGDGFQPSDVRLKKEVASALERPLWQDVDLYTWIWNELSPLAGTEGRGTLAQELISRGLEEFTTTYQQMVNPGDKENGIKPQFEERLAVNYTSLSFEMALAAGKKVDKLEREIELLKTEFGLAMSRLGG